MSINVKRSGAWSADVGYYDVFRKNSSGTWVNAEEVLRKVGSSWQQVWRKDGPPPDPTSVAASSANGGTNTITWAWTTNPEADYSLAEVEVSVNGGAFGSMATTAYPTTSQVRSGAANGSTYVYRVRFKDAGGNYSNWVSAASITGKNVNPSTPVVTVSAADWNTGGTFDVTISNIASTWGDVTNVSLYRRPAGGGGWTLVSSTGYTAASKVVNVNQIGYDTYHEFYASVTNLAGTVNSTVKSVYSRPSAGTVKNIACSNVHTRSVTNGVWRTDAFEARTGKFDNTWGIQMGLFFYGTAFEDNCRGHIPASVTILLIRNGTNGNTGTVDIWGHGYASKPSGAPSLVSGTGFTSANVFAGSDATGTETIPNTVESYIMDGTVKGFAVWHNSTSTTLYRVFRGPDTNGFAGLVSLTF